MHSGWRQQDTAQRDSTALAARELRDLRVRRGQAQGVHRHLQPLIEAPGVDRVDLVLERGLLLEHTRHLVVGQRLAELHAHSLELGDETADVGHAFVHGVNHRERTAEIGLLGEVTNLGAWMRLGLAHELRVDAGHDAQERALAGAVAADHADLRAGIKSKRDVLEDLLVGRVDARHLLHRKNELGHARKTMEFSASALLRRCRGSRRAQLAQDRVHVLFGVSEQHLGLGHEK